MMFAVAFELFASVIVRASLMSELSPVHVSVCRSVGLPVSLSVCLNICVSICPPLSIWPNHEKCEASL
jgi:hypothetical protein